MFSLGRVIALKENGLVHSCAFKNRANLSDLVETERLKFAEQCLCHLFIQARVLSQYACVLHAQCRSFFALAGEEKTRTTSDAAVGRRHHCHCLVARARKPSHNSHVCGSGFGHEGEKLSKRFKRRASKHVVFSQQTSSLPFWKDFDYAPLINTGPCVRALKYMRQQTSGALVSTRSTKNCA